MSDHTKGSSAHCEDCGLVYGCATWADVVIPDAIWNSLGADLLCFNCMTAALVRGGHMNVPVLVASGPYVCDSEKWRLLGWDHGHKVGKQEADDELLAALRVALGESHEITMPQVRAILAKHATGSKP